MTLRTALLACSIALLTTNAATAEEPPRHTASLDEHDPAMPPPGPAPSPDHVEDDAGDSHTFVHGDVIARMNPIGFFGAVGVTHRRPLNDRPETDLLYSEIAVDGTLSASPAHLQASAWARWLPLNVLPIRVQLDYYAYYGVLGSGLSFDAPTSAFGQGTLTSRADEGEASHAFRAMVEPTLRAKLGPVVLRSQTRLAYYHFTATGPYVYEAEHDTLLANDDLLVDNQTAVLFEPWSGPAHETVLFGPAYQVTYGRSADLVRHRVGGMLFLQPFESLGGFDRPRAMLLGGANLEDRNREGEPFFLFLLGSDFDLGGAR